MQVHPGFLWGIVLALLIGVACATLVHAPAQAPAPAPVVPAANPPEQLLPPANDENVLPPVPIDAPFELTGIWISEETTQYGIVHAETILEPNNNYSHQVRWNDLLTYEVGSYQVGTGYIHFMVEDYQPKTYKGTELSRPLSWTVWYTIIDKDTMRWEDHILNTSWEVTRREW